MTEPRIQRETLANGLRLVTEAMPHVRSVSIGVWLTRGSRHEPTDHAGIAHFVEHMLFKGTENRSAEDIAQQVDSIGGQLDAFTSKEYAGYYVKVLDQHLALAVDILTDLVSRPVFGAEDIEREKKVVLEEIKMVEDTPDDLVHEIFAEGFWSGHPSRAPDPRPAGDGVGARSGDAPALLQGCLRRSELRSSLPSAISSTRQSRRSLRTRFRTWRRTAARSPTSPPSIVPAVQVRHKDLEQSHVCLGTTGLPQNHADRYVGHALNTVLGGSMSSRLFQNVRERRGLAYSVFSSMSAYQDAGALEYLRGLRQRGRERTG